MPIELYHWIVDGHTRKMILWRLPGHKLSIISVPMT
jgi:hypothetical protein